MNKKSDQEDYYLTPENPERRKLQRETLSPIAHRKSSIAIPLFGQQPQTFPNHSENRQSEHGFEYPQNTTTTMLSENTLSVSENPYVYVNSEMDYVVPSK